MSRLVTTLKVKRTIKGLRINELASEIGYSEHTVSVTESGFQNASKNLQDAFATFFKCQRSDLFDEWGRALEYAE